MRMSEGTGREEEKNGWPQLIGGAELVVLPGLYWCFWFWPSLWLNWAGCCTSGNLTNQRVAFNF
jgi:hypothetical protein